jgi:methylglyoxal reductase
MVPTVSLGTWGHGGPNISGGVSVGWSGHDDRQAIEALLKAYQCGITHWDTADVYGNGNAERLIGSLWSQVPRKEIFLASKVGWDKGPYDHYYEPKHIQSQMDRSLKNLKTDVIDLYYLHHCDFGPKDRYFADAIEMLRRFQREGKIRFIGLSDWDSTKIMRFIKDADPDAVQPYRNVVDDGFESSGLRKWVADHNQGVAFFSPLKHGLLLGKYKEPVTFPEGDHRSRIPEFSDPRALERINRAAARVAQRFKDHPNPIEHALVGYLLSDCPTATVLIGQRNIPQVIAASQVGDPLSPEDTSWVRAAFRGEV